MPSSEREASRDGDRLALVHRNSAHSISSSIDSGRAIAIVPMWDSSDPERAPPPLPMNPSSPSVSSRGTSAAIKSAHAALTERARDQTYTINIPPPKRLTEPSPERLLIKGAAPGHKRMQSLQNGSVRDLSSFIESGTFGPMKPPEKSSTRPATPHASKDYSLESSPEKLDRISDKDSGRATSPTHHRSVSPRERRDSMHVRPSLRRPNHSMFGENTPPQSATMQALHNMSTTRETDPPLANVTNGSNALVRTPQTFDAISNQILSLTSICTSLQREMAQLSRRSKDNATDLVSLKEATNARDEDIRKSLRELVTGLSDAGSERTLYGGNNHFADNKGRTSPSSLRNSKGFSLPRIPSPNSFAASLDRETLLSTPLTKEYGREHISDAAAHAASVALLEKVLREMGTKEGQELLISRLTEIAEQLGREGMSTAKKLEELVEFIKKNTEISQALIAHHNNSRGESRGRNYSFEEDASRLELDFDRPASVAQRLEAMVATGADRERRKSQGPRRSSELLGDDVIQLIRSMKDSVAQGGGLTAEVKALVRELRGEVLGMGREIGRKLDQASKDGVTNGADVTGVVQNGLEDLKEHMNQLIRESRRQSSASANTQKIDYKEVYNVVRSAVTEKSESKEDIIDAVREAWENYKPDIELQHFGLEREELLVCLKEGIQEFAPQNDPGATRDEVFAAVIEGLKHFTPPPVENESLSRDEILDAVRECLEEFEFPAAPMPEPRDPDVTRDEMLHAVNEGLRTFDFSANPTALSAEILQGFTQTEMIQAVREGLKEFDFAALNRNNESITRNDVVTAIREGLQTSALAIQGREVDSGVTRDDVVGAVTESLHTFDFSGSIHLPHDEEAITRDDMFQAVRAGLESFEFPTLSREIGDTISRGDVFDAVKEGLNNFNFGALIPASDPEEQETGISREDIFEAVKDGLQTFDSALTRPAGGNTGINREDIFDAVKEGLHTFDSALTRDVGGSGSLTRNDVMDAVKDVLTTFDSALTRGNAKIGATREEIVDAMQEVMTKFHGSSLTRGPSQGITRDDVVDAVQEVLEGFNSALTTKNAGDAATRDEVFEAIKISLESHEPSGGITRNDVHEVIKENLQSHHTENGLTRSEIVDAVQEVLSTFDSALTREASSTVTRDEILGAVKEGLQAHTSNITRDEVLQAIKEGLQSKELITTRGDLESITRDDVFDAVKNGFEIHDIGGSITRHDILEAVKGGSFTREDILDAVKDGLQTFDSALTRGFTPTCTKADVFEAVRVGLQSQRFPPPVTREDIFEAVTDGLQTFNSAIVSVREANASKGDVFDAVKEGFETYNNALTLDIPVGVSRDDVLEAVKEGLQTLDTALTRENDVKVNRKDILEAVKEGLENFDFAAAKASTEVSREVVESITRDDVIQAVKAGLEDSPQSVDKFTAQVSERIHEIMESVRTEFKTFSDEAKQSVVAHGRDNEQLLNATKDGFEKLRSEIEAYVDRASDVTGKDEILENMRDNFATLRSEVEELTSNSSTAGFEKIQGELEHLRGSIASTLVKSGASDDKDEILDALKAGFDGLKASMEVTRTRDDDEDSLPGTAEIIDALQDGFIALKADLEKVANKPVDIDMTVNHEILDTLKKGLESVRADFDALKENQKNELAVAEISDRAIVPATDIISRHDFEKLEMLITQLGIKIAALESVEPPTPQLAPGAVTKEDLAAVKEMLQIIQDKVEGVVSREAIPDEDRIKKEDLNAIEILLHNTKAKLDEIDPEQSAKKEDIETMGAIVLEARDGVNALIEHLEEVPIKEDLSSIETAVREVLAGLAEIKEQVDTEFKSTDKVTKTDVEAVESVCLDIKSAIEQTVLPEFVALATKDEVNTLGTLVKETAGRIELHAATNAKAFEDRQAETVGVSERVTEVKSFLMEFRDAVKEKLDEGTTNVETVRTFLKGLGETINKNDTISEDLQAMFHAMTEEFEKTNLGFVGAKLETDEKFQKTWDKLDSHFEEKFTEIITKYDELQNFLEERATAGVEKTSEVEANILSIKQVADDVRVLLETLTTAVNESAEKMEEASKTVFNRVDETFVKVEETHAENKEEHLLTREQILKTLGIVEGVQGTVTEYNPQILESIKDVLNIVGQHHEHNKSSTETILEKIASIPPPPEIPPPVEYDDTPVHEKLDKLSGDVQEAGKSIAQLKMLDKLHQQMLATAAEVSQFVSNQAQKIVDDHESKEQAAAEAAIVLEKRLGQKEQVEASIASLKGEERAMKEYIAKLKTDKEDLLHQKMRLSSDVSSLETALRIRREELQEMEERAEGLERRILEGVIDHSRAMLLSKGNRKAARDPMSRKRVPTQRNSTAHSMASSVASKASSITQEAVNMAMKNRSPTKGPLANQAQRRILSLSQINNNLPNGNFKRTHSVKQSGDAAGSRKNSWGGTSNKSRNYGELNKENLALKEHQEENEDGYAENKENGELRDGGEESDNTMRRSSHGTTVITTNTDGDKQGAIGYTESIDGERDSESDYETETDLGTNSCLGTESELSIASKHKEGVEEELEELEEYNPLVLYEEEVM